MKEDHEKYAPKSFVILNTKWQKNISFRHSYHILLIHYNNHYAFSIICLIGNFHYIDCKDIIEAHVDDYDTVMGIAIS